MSGTTGTLEAVGAYLDAAREEVGAVPSVDFHFDSRLSGVLDAIGQAFEHLHECERMQAAALEQAGEVA